MPKTRGKPPVSELEMSDIVKVDKAYTEWISDVSKRFRQCQINGGSDGGSIGGSMLLMIHPS